jgi:hypothetical protein
VVGCFESGNGEFLFLKTLRIPWEDEILLSSEEGLHSTELESLYDIDVWLFEDVEVSILISIYLSTEIGLTPGGSTHLHTNNT